MLEYIKYAKGFIHTKSFYYYYLLIIFQSIFFFTMWADEVRHGLAGTLVIYLSSLLEKQNEIKTSEQHRSGKRGPPAFDVNKPEALGCLHASIGQTHISNLLSSLNNPTINSVTFKLREGQVGKLKLQSWKRIAESTCKHYLVIEEQEALQNGVQVKDNNLVPISWSCDMRWQKRGKGHNSLNGQEAVMGLSSGNCWTLQQGQKVVDFVIVPKPWKNNPKLMTAEKIMVPCQKQWSLLQELNCLSELQTKVWSFQFTGWWWLMMIMMKYTYGKKWPMSLKKQWHYTYEKMSQKEIKWNEMKSRGWEDNRYALLQYILTCEQ